MTSVRNVLAIAGKELRSYFASPIAYVIIGLFALLFGWFFYAFLNFFVEESQRAMMGGGTAKSNQHFKATGHPAGFVSDKPLTICPHLLRPCNGSEQRKACSSRPR